MTDGQRYVSRYRDGYYVVIDTTTGNVVPSPPNHYKKYRDGYLWDYAAFYEAQRLNDEHAHALARLEELRTELRAERISYGELFELQNLVEYIEPGDVELLEAAGVPEFPDDNA
jgi:hypothetical protein